MSIYTINNNKSLIYQLATPPEDVVGFYKKNSDFPGYRSVKENVEEISFRSDTGIRIWYNNLPIPFDFHRHNAIEIIVPVENWYRVYSQSECYEIQEGDILIVPPFEIHKIEAPHKGSRFI